LAEVDLNNRGMTNDIIVNLLPGVYEIGATVQITDAESGFNGHQVVLKSMAGPGRAVLTGGRVISNWQPHTNGIFKALVGTNRVFHTLFENGVRARKARQPNYIPSEQFKLSHAPYFLTAGVSNSYWTVQYDPSDIDPSTWPAGEGELFIWSGGGRDWYTDVDPVQSVDLVARQFHMANELRYPAYTWVDYLNTGSSRFFAQGLYQYLDAPGEFYLSTNQGILYYEPFGSPNPPTNVVAPLVQTILSVQGATPSNLVHDVVVDGLAFEFTDFAAAYRFGWVRAGDSGETHVYPAYDRQTELPEYRLGMVQAANTTNIVIKNCHFSMSGFSSLFLYGANAGDTFVNNLVEHSGYDGIHLEGLYPGEGNTMTGNLISNNLVRFVGELLGHASCVALANASDTLVSHCELDETPRYGVELYSLPSIPFADRYAEGNRFEYLAITNACQDSGDTAPVYFFGVNPGGVIDQVAINGTWHDPSSRDLPPSAIYMDIDSAGQLVSNAYVTKCESAPLELYSDSPLAYLENASWIGWFDPGFLSSGRLGVTPDFPYASAYPPVLGFPYSGPSGFSFQASLLPGLPYQVQSSSNLVDWSSLTNFTATGTPFYFYDAGSLNMPVRFYRLTSQ
jgi:hypothetical protein